MPFVGTLVERQECAASPFCSHRLWRAILQWVGGIGIIVMALTVLPLLRIGGMQLFRSEFSDRTEKILPRVSQITKAIFWTYAVLTLICVTLLWLVGLPGFDAICIGIL